MVIFHHTPLNNQRVIGVITHLLLGMHHQILRVCQVLSTRYPFLIGSPMVLNGVRFAGLQTILPDLKHSKHSSLCLEDYVAKEDSCTYESYVSWFYKFQLQICNYPNRINRIHSYPYIRYIYILNGGKSYRNPPFPLVKIGVSNLSRRPQRRAQISDRTGVGTRPRYRAQDIRTTPGLCPGVAMLFNLHSMWKMKRNLNSHR